jgi:hypothetical protein
MMVKLKTREEQIEEIIENMDWEKIHRTMTYLNWQWRDDGVPSIGKLVNEASRLLREVDQPANGGYARQGTGGLYATNTGYTLNLEFVLNSWQSDVDDNDE